MTNKYHYDPETCILYPTPRPGTVPYGEYNHALSEARKAQSRMAQVTITETVEIRCKVCGSNDVVKYGTKGSVQYYWCKQCKKKFAGNNALPGMRTPPEQIGAALSMFYDGLSLNAIRRQLQQTFNVYPSDSTVYEWVIRFTKLAVEEAKKDQVQTGNIWAVDETVLDVAGGRTKVGAENTIWFWDVIDEDTKFLLASHMSRTRTIAHAETLFTRAKQRSLNAPRFLVTDRLAAYLDGIERVFGAESTHIQSHGMRSSTHNNIIERFHGTLKARTKIMRGMQNEQTASLIMDGWLVQYNYFRPHESLGNKTPGEMAKTRFPYRNWGEVAMQGYRPERIRAST